MPPTIRGLVKIHKTDTPIRPIINWKEAPANKISKFIAKKLPASHYQMPLKLIIPQI
jgi:hypothetical protein